MTIPIKSLLSISRYTHIKEAHLIASKLRTITPSPSHNVAITCYMITTKHDNSRDPSTSTLLLTQLGKQVQNDETQNPHSKINAIDRID